MPSKPLLYFFVPFLLLAPLMVWASFRISRPAEAVQSALEFLEEKVPGTEWELSKVVKLGDGLDKKWRMEFAASVKDGRVAQANLVVDRWRPSRVAGKFVVLLNPPQILDGGWDKRSFWDSLSPKIPQILYPVAAAVFLLAQCFWLYRARVRGNFLRRDGVVLALLGSGVMVSQAVLEVHPGFLAGYAAVACFVVAASFGGRREG